MALRARKTEHAGPKKGRGAFYGHKAEAKHDSNRRRREDDKLALAEHDLEPAGQAGLNRPERGALGGSAR